MNRETSCGDIAVGTSDGGAETGLSTATCIAEVTLFNWCEQRTKWRCDQTHVEVSCGGDIAVGA